MIPPVLYREPEQADPADEEPKAPSNNCVMRCLNSTCGLIQKMVCDIAKAIFKILSFPAKWICPPMPRTVQLPAPSIEPEGNFEIEEDFVNALKWDSEVVEIGTPNKGLRIEESPISHHLPPIRTPYQAAGLSHVLAKQQRLLKDPQVPDLRKLKVLKDIWCNYYSDPKGKGSMKRARKEAFENLPALLRQRLSEASKPENRILILAPGQKQAHLLGLLEEDDHSKCIEMIENIISKVMKETAQIDVSTYDYESWMSIARDRRVARIAPGTPILAVRQVVKHEPIEPFCDDPMSKAWKAWQALPDCADELKAYLTDKYPEKQEHIEEPFLTTDMKKYLTHFEESKRQQILLDALDYLFEQIDEDG